MVPSSAFLRHQTTLQGFHCFIICLLRQCSVLAFDCPFLCLLRVTICSGYFYVIILGLFNVSIVLLYVYYVTALFKVLTVTFSVCYVTRLSLQDFHCFVICLLRHCCVQLSPRLSHPLFVTSLIHYTLLFKIFFA